MYSQITKKTFDSIFEKKYALMKGLLIPFIILTIIEYFTTVEVKELIGSASYYLLIGLSFLVTIVMSITIHRILLLNEEKTPKWGIYKFTGREVTFALKALGLGLLLFLIAMIFSFVIVLFEKVIAILSEEFITYYTIIAWILVFGFLGMVFSRVSLVFPAIAIDKPIDFGDAFEISKDYKLFIFVCVLIIPAILGLIVGLVYGLAIEFLMGIISSKLSVLLSLLNIFITVFTVAFLSSTYEFIMSKQPEKNEKFEEKINEIEFIENEKSFKINIDERYNLNFDTLKKELLEQYESLGFTKIALDKEESWLLKNPEVDKAYVLLTYKNKQYTVETYNVSQKPVINI